ncbi:hypothetical protein ASwh1_371 [Aeromonas phage Aswh_1]|nr:hypothetical protein ASwh1_371 [Aeromonas phage Aswh_1]
MISIIRVIFLCVVYGIGSNQCGNYHWIGTLSVTRKGLVVKYCQGNKWITMMVTSRGLYKNIQSGIWKIL